MRKPKTAKRSWDLGVSENRGTLFLIIRIPLVRVLYWGSPIFGNFHFGSSRCGRQGSGLKSLGAKVCSFSGLPSRVLNMNPKKELLEPLGREV